MMGKPTEIAELSLQGLVDTVPTVRETALVRPRYSLCV